MLLHRLPPIVSRHTCAKALLLASMLNMLLPPHLAYGRKLVKSKVSSVPASAATAEMEPLQSPVETFVRVINLPTNDLVFNSQTQKLHATVPSRAGANGNSVTDIDPVMGAVVQTVFVGSEPNKLALSADGA